MLEYDNPYAVGLTGLLCNETGARAITEGKLLLMLGRDFACENIKYIRDL